MKIFFYVFGNTSYIFNEVIKLSQQRKKNIEWGMIYPRSVYKESATDLVKRENIFYLFNDFDKVYNSIDTTIDIDDSKWIDNIHTIIESSKFGYKKENSKRQLKVIHTLYKLYKDFLINNRPDYLVFPDIETVNGVLLLNICKELDIEVMVTVHTRQIDTSFFAQDYRESLPIYFGEFNSQDIERAKSFILNPIEKAIIGNQRPEQKIEIKPYANIFKRLINSIQSYFRYERQGIFDTNLYLRIRLNFEKYFEIYRELLFNYYQINFFDIKSKNDKIPNRYILFLLQVTPESSINTYSQYFIEQERAIDLIRLNMPTELTLLVKEHPAMRGMRNSKWYKKMRKKSGISLVSHTVDTMNLVQKSHLVATITGSVGLECYHINKPVMMFGQTFFSHLVNRFNCIDNLKVKLKSPKDNIITQKEKKIEDIAKIYNISYDFFVHEPFHFERVMTKNNISNLLEAIILHISKVNKFV